MQELQRREKFWQPQDGPQAKFVDTEHPDVFYGGARGGGKSVAILQAFKEHAERYGEAARGLLFRRTYPETTELERLGRDILVREGWGWKASEREWISPRGAILRLAHLDRDDDVMKYQGFSNTFLGFDELTNWPDAFPIDQLRATLRSASGVPVLFRATGNPGGPGHSWVKDRYIDNREEGREFIPSSVRDNRLLIENDPGYVPRLRQVGAEWLVRAWLEGDWNIVPGAYFEDVWDHQRHVCDPFEIPMHWKRWRAMDHGYAAPTSVGWYAIDENGVIYRYRELYTWDGKPNKGSRMSTDDIAAEILRLEKHERKAGIRFMHNVADSAMWAEQGHARSIATAFMEAGIVFSPAKKGPRSRVNGAQEIVRRLNQDKFKVFRTCHHFLRTFPVLVPDPKDPEDIDTEQEDHVYDEVRYSLMSRRLKSRKPEEKKGPEPGTFDYLLNPKLWEDRTKLKPSVRLQHG